MTRLAIESWYEAETASGFLRSQLLISPDLADRAIEAACSDAGATEFLAASRAACDADSAVALLTQDHIYFVSSTTAGSLRVVRWRRDEVQEVHSESRSLGLDHRWYQLVDVPGEQLASWLKNGELG